MEARKKAITIVENELKEINSKAPREIKGIIDILETITPVNGRGDYGRVKEVNKANERNLWKYSDIIRKEGLMVSLDSKIKEVIAMNLCFKNRHRLTPLLELFH